MQQDLEYFMEGFSFSELPRTPKFTKHVSEMILNVDLVCTWESVALRENSFKLNLSVKVGKTLKSSALVTPLVHLRTLTQQNDRTCSLPGRQTCVDGGFEACGQGLSFWPGHWNTACGSIYCTWGPWRGFVWAPVKCGPCPTHGRGSGSSYGGWGRFLPLQSILHSFHKPGQTKPKH